MVAVDVKLLKRQQFPWHRRQFGQPIAGQLHRVQHSVLVLEEIVGQGGDVVVVSVERPQLVTAVQPVRHLGKQIVADINVTDVFGKWLDNQAA